MLSPRIREIQFHKYFSNINMAEYKTKLANFYGIECYSLTNFSFFLCDLKLKFRLTIHTRHLRVNFLLPFSKRYKKVARSTKFQIYLNISNVFVYLKLLFFSSIILKKLQWHKCKCFLSLTSAHLFECKNRYYNFGCKSTSFSYYEYF